MEKKELSIFDMIWKIDHDDRVREKLIWKIQNLRKNEKNRTKRLDRLAFR